MLTEINIYLGQPRLWFAVMRGSRRRIICTMQFEYALELVSYWTYRASHYFMVSLVDDPAYLALIFT